MMTMEQHNQKVSKLNNNCVDGSKSFAVGENDNYGKINTT